MGYIDNELTEIEVATRAAYEEIENENYSKARKIIKKIRNSPCILESDRAVTLIEALILLYERNKKRKAKQLILSRNDAAWGCEDLLTVLSFCNPPSDKDSKLYRMLIKGGCATFGMLTQFTNEHYCEVSVAANTREEALAYIAELANFASKQDMQLVEYTESILPAEEKYRGVLNTTPFSLRRDIATIIN